MYTIYTQKKTVACTILFTLHVGIRNDKKIYDINDFHKYI